MGIAILYYNALEPIRNFFKLGLPVIHYLTSFKSSYYPPPSATKGFLIARHTGTLGTSPLIRDMSN